MSAGSGGVARYAIVCVDDEISVRDALVRDLEALAGGLLTVEACAGADEARALLEDLHAGGCRVPLLFADQVMPGRSGSELLIDIHGDKRFRSIRKVLVSGQCTLEDVSRALNQGALHRNLGKPWDPGHLRECLSDLLTDYLIETDPGDLERFEPLLEVGRLSQALRDLDAKERRLDTQLRQLQLSFLADTPLSDEEVESAMIRGIDEALDHPPRGFLARGETLFEAGQTLGGIYVIETGRIKLVRRVGEREIILHSHSAGRVIGLLALTQNRRANFGCRAVTDVTYIPLSPEQIETALTSSVDLARHFVTVLIRTLANRNRRVAELHTEVEALNDTLARDRDRLAEALATLNKAQQRLIASEKMATLGQLSAGIAHELNNPIAALRRAVDFIVEDLDGIVAGLPDSGEALLAMDRALHAEPLSTREEREARKALAAKIGDETLARRLVKIGVRTVRDLESRFAGRTGGALLSAVDEIERFHRLGISLRTTRSCTDRVSALVRSLKSHARPDRQDIAEMDVNESLEDTLLLFAHNLRRIEIVRDYGPLPPILCRPGEIGQVWTNVIANAVQAMDGEGTLTVQTDALDAESRVRVRIADTGPGIPPEHLEKVFDLNFTTKQGAVSFGLGMGLTICRQIVRRHGGTIELVSRPGATCVTVILPRRCPRDLESGAPEPLEVSP